MALDLAMALPFMGGGGTERVALALLDRLPKDRFRSTLYLFERKGPLVGRIPSHVEVVDLGAPRLRRAGPRLFAEFRRQRPDVVFSTLGYINLAMLAMRPFLPKRPRLIIREPNTPSLSLPNLAFSRTLAIGYRLLYPQADAIVCQSNLMARELAQDFAVPERLLRRIANPVDVEALRASARTPRRHPGDGVRLVVAGRLTKQKGLDRLLPWVAALAGDAHVTILGEGPDGPALKAQAAALGIAGRVAFAGFVPDPAPAIAGADALLLPSRWEGMPNAALEALALGTPVIGTPESGGLAEVAEDCAAVAMAAAGDAFVRAMRGVRPMPATEPRPSLLPARFGIERVVDAYAALLEGRT